MSDRFIITGMGRSGTTWLSHLMNQSPTWTVCHEPGYKQRTREQAIAQFRSRYHYGEVNSLARSYVMDIPADYHGVIIRDPVELWLSIANRCRSREPGVPEAMHLYESLADLMRAVEAGAEPLDFHRLTNDLDYLNGVIRGVGIDDLEVTAEQMRTRRNVTKRRRFHRLHQFDGDLLAIVDDCREMVSGVCCV